MLYYYFYDLISQWNYIYIIHILHPIKHFTILEPQNPKIDKFYFDQKRQSFRL